MTSGKLSPSVVTWGAPLTLCGPTPHEAVSSLTYCRSSLSGLSAPTHATLVNFPCHSRMFFIVFLLILDYFGYFFLSLAVPHNPWNFLD